MERRRGAWLLFLVMVLSPAALPAAAASEYDSMQRLGLRLKFLREGREWVPDMKRSQEAAEGLAEYGFDARSCGILLGQTKPTGELPSFARITALCSVVQNPGGYERRWLEWNPGSITTAVVAFICLVAFAVYLPRLVRLAKEIRRGADHLRRDENN